MRYQIERLMLRYRWVVVLGLVGMGWFLLFSAVTTEFRCSMDQATTACDGPMVPSIVLNPWLGAVGGMVLCAAGLV